MNTAYPSTNLLASQSLVLVADDDANIRNLLHVTLERAGFRVASVPNGRDAVNKAQELRPDLILMDVRMPIMDGFEAVKTLRSIPVTQRIPVIFLTAQARNPSDAARGFDVGADDYLLKPFGTDELLARARSKVRARQLEERLQQRTQELEALIRIGAKLNETIAIDELIDRLILLTLEHVPGSVAGLLRVDVPPSLAARFWTPDGIRADDVDGEYVTFMRYIVRIEEPLLINNAHTAAEYGIQTLTGTIQSAVGVPLVHNNKTQGVLLVGDFRPDTFTEANLRLLRSIGEQATLALRNAQLYEQLQGHAQGLEVMVEARTEALQAAQTQLVRAEKLASLGTLAAGVAHEVNNPLQPILMNLDMAIEDMDQGRQVDRELLEIARTHVQRIKGIVQRLLDFSRPESQTLSTLDVNGVIEEVLSLAGKQLQNTGVKVVRQLNLVSPIRGNADQLKQVVLNLVVNAMDAMPSGGTLTVSSGEQDDYVTIIVLDNGIGIPPDSLSKVFDPFYTTKADGTGLGLAVSYGLVQGHGGQIEVHSTPGIETRFTIRLPCASLGSQG